MIWDSFGEGQDWGKAAVRGLGAGVVSVLLYGATQLLAVPAMLDELDVRRLLSFMIPVGFGAGFTFDLVYERLQTNQDPPSAPQPPADPGGG